MPGEIDRNILLSSPQGERWVLKLAPANIQPAEIECQLAVLQFLETSDLSPLVPRLVADRSGSVTRSVRTDRGDEGRLRIVTFLPGRPLQTVKSVPRALHRSIGRFLGQLDQVLVDFDHPGAHRPLFWNLLSVLDLRPNLQAVEPDLQPLILAGLDRFEERILPRLAELPHSVIHNDANDYNLLIQEVGDGFEFRGIIDFGDMVYTLTAAEPAIACAYLMLDQEDPLEVQAIVTEGYESARPLTPLERELLPDLIMARLCNSLLMSAQARTTAPDDEYLRISERPIIALLERLSLDP